MVENLIVARSTGCDYTVYPDLGISYSNFIPHSSRGSLAMYVLQFECDGELAWSHFKFEIIIIVVSSNVHAFLLLALWKAIFMYFKVTSINMCH
jgi:hypothetical protein